MTATTAIVVYFDGTDLVCRLLTYSGASLSPGAIATIDAGFSAADTDRTSGTRLSDTAAMYMYISGATNFVILTVSGTSVSVGSITGLSSEVGNSIDALNATNAIYVGRRTSLPVNDIEARVLSVSGTTITANALFTFDTNANTSTGAPEVTALTATEACSIWRDTTTNRKVRKRGNHIYSKR